jgi:hypothetical protein
MTDTQDNTKPLDPAQRLDDLFAAIRNALASEAPADARSAGAIACRAILGVLEPPAPRAAVPAAPSSPIGAALGAIGTIPREQLLEFVVGGLRSIFAQSSAPAYRSRPTPMPPRGSGGEP